MLGAGRPDRSAGAVWWSGLAGLAIIALSFLPLVVHELTNDFSEIHAALDYLRGGGQPGAASARWSASSSSPPASSRGR